MPAKPYPTDAIEQAQSILTAWTQIGSETVTFGELNYAALEAEVKQSIPIQADLEDLELKLTSARNQRDALNLSIWDKVKRVRAAVKGIYGDDSNEYELMGGTRLSERKTPTRKKKE